MRRTQTGINKDKGYIVVVCLVYRVRLMQIYRCNSHAKTIKKKKKVFKYSKNNEINFQGDNQWKSKF